MRAVLYCCAFVICLASNAGVPSAAAEAAQPVSAPQWHLDEIAFLTRGGGRWIASNAEYKNENEPFDEYVIEWKQDYAKSMSGRLFGVADGKPSVDFWRYRQYWHPGKGEAILQQFGAGGAVGVGPLRPDDGKMRLEQVFYPPSGGTNRMGHISYNPDADTHVTESYAIQDGEWTLNRTYIWRRDNSAASD